VSAWICRDDETAAAGGAGAGECRVPWTRQLRSDWCAAAAYSIMYVLCCAVC